jgi:hypothetical protein
MGRFRADDRVLSLAVPPLPEAALLGRLLMTGCLVALGDAEEVDEARRALAEFDNLMFLVASPERIPWQDAFFTKILVPTHLQSLLGGISGELQRVLAPGGEIVSNAENA